MKKTSSLSRRDFIKITSVAGLGLVVAIYLPGCKRTPDPTATSTATPVPTPTPTPEPPAFLSPNIYVTVGNDGSVTLTCPRPDLGQGNRTALPMILAEELGVDWTSVKVTQADADPVFGEQLVGGSTSTEKSYTQLRRAGAVVRSMLVAAAAEKWGVAPESCFAEKGSVINKETNESLPYSSLVTTAMTYDPKNFQKAKLKDPKDFTIIGTTIPRVDGPDIVTGKAVFGLDIRTPDMLYAVIAHSPTFGGKLISFDDSEARSVPGVVDVIEITSGMSSSVPNKSVAVLARDTWSAIQGRNALKVSWDEGPRAEMSSADIEQELAADVTKTLATGELEAYYTVPFLSHSPMETINSTCRASEKDCEVWAPTQDPRGLQNFISSRANIPTADVHLHVPLAGGGFGRRLEFPDGGTLPVFHLQESFELSKAAGVPVKVVWTRDDDMHYEYYHPLSVTRVSARLDDITTLRMNRSQNFGNGVPTGAWRAVTNIPEAFAHESFIDEFAAATGQDTIDLHMKVLNKWQREVLDLVVKQSGWGSELPPGHGRGIAIHSTWGVSPCAQVAEVMVDENGNVKVLKVVCAINCGVVINPDMVKAQMEGGIIFGMTSTLKAHISISKGRVDQSNFHDYPLIKMDEAPEIEVHILKSDSSPTGTGEMGNPPIAPAIANAIFAVTGKRLRRLPILPGDIVSA